MRLTYGICYGTGISTIVRQYKSLACARRAAQAAAEAAEVDVDVVVLEGLGAVYDSEGIMIAPCHAPAYAVTTYPGRRA